MGGLFGLLPYAEDLGTVLYHIGVGLIFAYVGFGRRLDEQMVRQVVGGFGALIVVVKATLTLAPLLWGGPLLFDGVEFTCLVIGPFSLLAAAYLPDQQSPPHFGRKREQRGRHMTPAEKRRLRWELTYYRPS